MRLKSASRVAAEDGDGTGTGSVSAVLCLDPSASEASNRTSPGVRLMVAAGDRQLPRLKGRQFASERSFVCFDVASKWMNEVVV